MVEWSWWDSSLIWKTNWLPSVLWHRWFGYMTCKIVPDMTYNVFGGTLNLAQSVKSTYVLEAHVGEMSTLPKLTIRHSPPFLFYRSFFCIWKKWFTCCCMCTIKSNTCTFLHDPVQFFNPPAFCDVCFHRYGNLTTLVSSRWYYCVFYRILVIPSLCRSLMYIKYMQARYCCVTVPVCSCNWLLVSW